MARLEKIAPPEALLAELRARAEDHEREREAEVLAQAKRSEQRSRGLRWLGAAFVSMFAVPIALELTGVEALGLAGALFVFFAFGYGAFQVFKSLGGRFDRVTAPPDPGRFAVAAEVLETLLPELSDAEATLWVVTDHASLGEVTSNKRKDGGKWVTVRTLDWFQLEAQAKDGSTWTLGARLVRQEKSKPKRGGTRTKLGYQERVQAKLQPPKKSPLPSALSSGVARLEVSRGAVSSALRIARARARPRAVELDLLLDEDVRSARVSDSMRLLDGVAVLRAHENAHLRSEDILVAAAVLGRLRA